MTGWIALVLAIGAGCFLLWAAAQHRSRRAGRSRAGGNARIDPGPPPVVPASDAESFDVWGFNDIGEPYYVPLKRCATSAQCLDWILQVAKKTWCTPQMLYDLVEQIELACREVHGKSAQSVFCPGGSYREVKWE